MNIALITNSWPQALNPSSGIFIADQVKALKDIAQVDLFQPRPFRVPGTKSAKELEAPLLQRHLLRNVFRPRYLSAPRKALPSLVQAKLSRALLSELNPRAYDHLFVHFFYPCGLSIPKLAKLNPNTHLFIHGSDWNELHTLKRFQPHFKNVFACAKTIFTSGRQLRESIVAHFPEHSHKIQVLFNPIDDSAFVPPPDKNRIKLALNWNLKNRHLLMVANYVPIKGHAQLIKSLSEIRSQLKMPLSVHFVGGQLHTNYAQQLRKQAREYPELSFHFEGTMSREDLILRYQAADLYIQNSAQEGFGNTMIESLLCRLPGLIRPVGAGRTLVKNGWATTLERPELQLPAFINDSNEQHPKSREQIAQMFGIAAYLENLSNRL